MIDGELKQVLPKALNKEFFNKSFIQSLFSKSQTLQVMKLYLLMNLATAPDIKGYTSEKEKIKKVYLKAFPDE